MKNEAAVAPERADSRMRNQMATDADSLLKEVLRSQRKFQSEVIWSSDVILVVVSILLLLVWLYMGVKNSSPWTWYLTVPVLVWDVVFIQAYQLHHRQKPCDTARKSR